MINKFLPICPLPQHESPGPVLTQRCWGGSRCRQTLARCLVWAQAPVWPGTGQRCVPPKLNSQSDDLCSRPAPPSSGSGPSQLWERTRLYRVPHANTSLQHLSSQELASAQTRELCWPPSSSALTQEALCAAFSAGLGWDYRSPVSESSF